MTLIRSKIAGIADIARDREKTKTQNLTADETRMTRIRGKRSGKSGHRKNWDI